MYLRPTANFAYWLRPLSGAKEEGEVEAETPAHPGELRNYMHNYYPDKNKDGTVVGVSCVVYDITERMEREAGSRPRP